MEKATFHHIPTSSVTSSVPGNFWAQQVKILVFPSPVSYMLISIGFCLLMWHILYKLPQNDSEFSWSLELRPVSSQTHPVHILLVNSSPSSLIIRMRFMRFLTWVSATLSPAVAGRLEQIVVHIICVLMPQGVFVSRVSKVVSYFRVFTSLSAIFQKCQYPNRYWENANVKL